MDRRLFLRSLVAVAGAAALVPLAAEAMAAPRRPADDIKPQDLEPGAPETVDGDIPADGSSDAQYYYRRPYRRRVWRRRAWRRRMWGRPMWRRPGWRRRTWRRRAWRRGYW